MVECVLVKPLPGGCGVAFLTLLPKLPPMNIPMAGGTSAESQSGKLGVKAVFSQWLVLAGRMTFCAQYVPMGTGQAKAGPGMVKITCGLPVLHGVAGQAICGKLPAMFIPVAA